MKKAISFKGGVRGKYAGKKLTILGATYSSKVSRDAQPTSEAPLVVSIDEDIAAFFKTPEAINRALRSLIQILTIADR